nr:hypothetical protein [uncultured Erwinia sp.]
MNPNHPLVKLARERKLPHPHRPEEFSERAWTEVLRQYGDPQGVGFASGAVWLNGHFRRIERSRQQFTCGEETPLNYIELARAHLAAANAAFYQVINEQIENDRQREPVSLEQMLARRSAQTAGGEEAAVNSVNMQRLDSLCLVLWELFKYRDRLSTLFPAVRPRLMSRMDLLYNESKMSQYYHSFSLLWQEMLYGHAAFAADRDRVLLQYIGHFPHAVKAVSEYRRDHHHGTTALEAGSMLRQRMIMVEGPQLCYQGPDRPLTLCGWQALSEDVQLQAAYQWISPQGHLDHHLRPLIDENSEVEADRRLQRVLRIWFHLSVLAKQISEEHTHGRRPLPDDWQQMLALAPAFDRQQLVRLLTGCTGYSVQQVEQALKILTWRGKTLQEDLWVQPLVELEGDVAFPVSAFLTASFSRNFDCWLQKIDSRHERRGRLFEQDLLRVMAECRQANPLMREHLHFSPVGKFYAGEDYEEIDLAFTFGNLVVVAEARSRKTPITPLDYHNDMFDDNGLLHKTTQAKRKADYVRKHLADFCAIFFPHLEGRDDLQVLPLTLINGQYHAGYALNEVAVLDTALLLHFLKDGELRFNFDAERGRHQYALPLYGTLEEAQAIFADYIRSPLLIRIYEALIVRDTQASRPMGEGFEEIITQTCRVDSTDWQTFMAAVERVAPGRVVQYF